MTLPTRRGGLVPAGFALLALAGVFGILSLASAELENDSLTTTWGTAAFAVGVIGAVAALVGAFWVARSPPS